MSLLLLASKMPWPNTWTIVSLSASWSRKPFTFSARQPNNKIAPALMAWRGGAGSKANDVMNCFRRAPRGREYPRNQQNPPQQLKNWRTFQELSAPPTAAGSPALAQSAHCWRHGQHTSQASSTLRFCIAAELAQNHCGTRGHLSFACEVS